MGEMIQFPRGEGAGQKEMVPGYLSRPSDGGVRRHGGGVVLLQEWWGLREELKRTADRLAGEGYFVLVPDLYRGQLTNDPAEAGKLMNGLDWGGAVKDIAAAGAHLKSLGHGKVAVMGFCMGGALSILGGIQARGQLDAVVCFYGVPPAQAADPAELKIPFLGHFAKKDQWVSPEVQARLKERLEAGKVPHAMHVYDADHAFFNDARPEVYSPKDADAAWTRTTDFLAQNIG